MYVRTTAQNVPSDLVIAYQTLRVRIRDITSEMGIVNHLLKVGPCLRMSQQRLREEVNQLYESQ